MSTTYSCAQQSWTSQSKCDESYTVNVAARERFAVFFEPGSLGDHACDDCKHDEYGYVRCCPAHCLSLAAETERQTIKDTFISEVRDRWVAFLRHCADHGGCWVQY